MVADSESSEFGEHVVRWKTELERESEECFKSGLERPYVGLIRVKECKKKKKKKFQDYTAAAPKEYPERSMGEESVR